MPRIHAPELEDEAWFPPELRRLMQDYLHFLAHALTSQLLPVADRLAELLSASGQTRIVDLCSGGGSHAVVLARHLRERHGMNVELVLTDLYPNTAAMAEQERKYPWIRGERRPVDARAVPPELGGVRLMCNAFHHFRPDDAAGILADAAAAGQPIAVMEVVERSLFGIASVVLGGAAPVPIVTPLIRPWRLSRFAWTYVVPVVPLSVLWDGVCSCLRAYDVAELRALTERVAAPPGFRWDVGRVRLLRGPASVTLLLGGPRGSGGASPSPGR